MTRPRDFGRFPRPERRGAVTPSAYATGMSVSLLVAIWQGMVHVFPANVALLQAARETLDITGEFLRSNLGR